MPDKSEILIECSYIAIKNWKHGSAIDPEDILEISEGWWLKDNEDFDGRNCSNT